MLENRFSCVLLVLGEKANPKFALTFGSCYIFKPKFLIHAETMSQHAYNSQCQDRGKTVSRFPILPGVFFETFDDDDDDDKDIICCCCLRSNTKERTTLRWLLTCKEPPIVSNDTVICQVNDWWGICIRVAL